jgi:capsid protein
MNAILSTIGHGFRTIGSRLFGYSLAEHDPRRPRVPVSFRSEDWELDESRRGVAVSESRDIFRNFSVARWAVRRHLDFVSRFTFKSKIGDLELDRRYAGLLTKNVSDDLNRQIEELVWEWSQPENFEVTGRYSLSQFMRLAEAARTIDGDLGVLKIRGGRDAGKVQAVEGDRIRNERGSRSNEWVQGVRLDAAGRATAYRVWERGGFGGNNFANVREISADNMILHGYFDRFDQVRGIGLLFPAVKTLRDLYKGFDYALFKAMISQMMGYKFTVDPNKGFNGEGLTEDDTDKTTEYRKQVLKEHASFFIELNEGEDMDIVAANTPTNEFQDYSRMMIKVALKALDIPYAMYDETEGKFYGNKSGVLQYVETCRAKREDNEGLLNKLTRWRLNYEVLRGRLKLPGDMTVDDVYFTWTPTGLPWWNMGAEVKEMTALIESGLASETQISQMFGWDYAETQRQRKRDLELRRNLGLADDVSHGGTESAEGMQNETSVNSVPLCETKNQSQSQTSDLQQTALNGAQVTAAVDIVTKVAAGELPVETAIVMLMEFFQLDEAVARKMVEPAAKEVAGGSG